MPVASRRRYGAARRPVILPGSGVRAARATAEFDAVIRPLWKPGDHGVFARPDCLRRPAIPLWYTNLGKRVGLAIKLTRSPRVASAIRSARDVLDLEQIPVVRHGAAAPWPLSDGITAVVMGSLDVCLTDYRRVVPLVAFTDQTFR